MLLAPPKRSGVIKAPKEGMKTKITPAQMPDRLSGTSTLKKVFQGEQPKSADASKSDFSIFSRTVYSGRIIKGSSPYTRPTRMAKLL